MPESQPTKTEEEGVQGSARRELTAEGERKKETRGVVQRKLMSLLSRPQKCRGPAAALTAQLV